jgi:hypothetical protein
MKNTGTLVTAAIRPNDSNDKIASAYAIEIKGGLHSYETLVTRNSIITERREWGMLVNVYNDTTNNGTYQLVYSKVDTDIMNNSNWTRFSSGSGSSGGGSAFWLDPVLDIRNAQPSPVDGARYIIGSAPTGAQWASISPNTIVQYELASGTWQQTTALSDMSVRINSDGNAIYRFNGVSWIKEKIRQVFSLSATSSNAITYTGTSSLITSYDTDSLYVVQFATANAGTGVTINLNGLGSRPVYQQTNYGTASFTGKDISPSVQYGMYYDGSAFRLNKPTAEPTFTRYKIQSNETVVVPAYQEYLVYGNLEVNGFLNVDPMGKVVIINGALNINGGTVSNTSNVSLVTLATTVSNLAVRKKIMYDTLPAGVDKVFLHNLDSVDIVVSVYNNLSLITNGISVEIGSSNDISITSTNTITNARVVIMG